MAGNTLSEWQLRLVGTPCVRQEGSQWLSLRRKSAGLLSYLALQGPTSRSRLAQLLWPDLPENAQRRDLRLLIHELRRFDGLLVTGDPLELSSRVRVESSGTGLPGQLLEGFSFDDCPEFDEWLAYRREVSQEQTVRALLDQTDGFEQEGNFEAALDLSRRLVQLEPLSEEAHRRLMRFLYLNGDRAGALEAYHRCQRVLQAELGIAPLPETVALAREIARGAVLPDMLRSVRPIIPLSVSRPPVLVGRAREWALMEEAWERGQVILITGEAGAGKSRLMLEFAASKGRFQLFQGMPGDSSVAYASHVRNLRKVLSAYPEYQPASWVRYELSRLLPELAEETPPPLETAAQLRRMLDAHVAFMANLKAWVDTYVNDDLHLYDLASLELGGQLVTRLLPAVVGEAGLRLVAALRMDELDSAYAEALRRMVEGGLAVMIELEPLEPEAVTAMLEGTELSGLASLSKPIYKLTGGNPLFIVETLKSLVEVADIAHALDQPLLPNRVGLVLEQRLRRLSAGALRVARLLAVAQVDFSAELVASVLNLDPLEVAERLAELETAHIIRGTRFSHDLMYETVRRSTSDSLAGFFHRRSAEYLEAQGGRPGRIAYHWWESGQRQKALGHLLLAAQAAAAKGASSQAGRWFEQIVEYAVPGSELQAAAWLGLSSTRRSTRT